MVATYLLSKLIPALAVAQQTYWANAIVQPTIIGISCRWLYRITKSLNPPSSRLSRFIRRSLE